MSQDMSEESDEAMTSTLVKEARRMARFSSTGSEIENGVVKEESSHDESSSSDGPPEDINLCVILPDSTQTNITVSYSIQMMDLLVQVAAANHLSPATYTFAAYSEETGRKIDYHASQTVGSLGVSTISMVSKKAKPQLFKQKKTEKTGQPFETTRRVTFNLPRNQKTVLRLSPKLTMAAIFQTICKEKNLNPYKHELRHPTDPDKALNMAAPLETYGIHNITVITVADSDTRKSFGSVASYEETDNRTSTPILVRQEDQESFGSSNSIPNNMTKEKKGFFSKLFSRKKEGKFNVSGANYSGSNTNLPVSVESTTVRNNGNAASRPPPVQQPAPPQQRHTAICHSNSSGSQNGAPAKPPRKKRQAPPPPPQPTKNTISEVITTAETTQIEVLHSRTSSHSSGFEESALSPLESPSSTISSGKTEHSSQSRGTKTSLDATSVESSDTSVVTSPRVTVVHQEAAHTSPSDRVVEQDTASSTVTSGHITVVHQEAPEPLTSITTTTTEIRTIKKKRKAPAPPSAGASEVDVTIERQDTILSEASTPMTPWSPKETVEVLPGGDFSYEATAQEEQQRDNSGDEAPRRGTQNETQAESSTRSILRPAQFIPPPPPNTPPPEHPRSAFSQDEGLGPVVADSSTQVHVTIRDSLSSEPASRSTSICSDQLDDIQNDFISAIQLGKEALEREMAQDVGQKSDVAVFVDQMRELTTGADHPDERDEDDVQQPGRFSEESFISEGSYNDARQSYSSQSEAFAEPSGHKEIIVSVDQKSPDSKMTSLDMTMSAFEQVEQESSFDTEKVETDRDMPLSYTRYGSVHVNAEDGERTNIRRSPSPEVTYNETRPDETDTMFNDDGEITFDNVEVVYVSPNEPIAVIPEQADWQNVERKYESDISGNVIKNRDDGWGIIEQSNSDEVLAEYNYSSLKDDVKSAEANDNNFSSSYTESDDKHADIKETNREKLVVSSPETLGLDLPFNLGAPAVIEKPVIRRKKRVEIPRVNTLRDAYKRSALVEEPVHYEPISPQYSSTDNEINSSPIKDIKTEPIVSTTYDDVSTQEIKHDSTYVSQRIPSPVIHTSYSADDEWTCTYPVRTISVGDQVSTSEELAGDVDKNEYQMSHSATSQDNWDPTPTIVSEETNVYRDAEADVIRQSDYGYSAMEHSDGHSADENFNKNTEYLEKPVVEIQTYQLVKTSSHEQEPVTAEVADKDEYTVRKVDNVQRAAKPATKLKFGKDSNVTFWGPRPWGARTKSEPSVRDIKTALSVHEAGDNQVPHVTVARDYPKRHSEAVRLENIDECLEKSPDYTDVVEKRSDIHYSPDDNQGHELEEKSVSFSEYGTKSNTSATEPDTDSYSSSHMTWSKQSDKPQDGYSTLPSTFTSKPSESGDRSRKSLQSQYKDLQQQFSRWQHQLIENQAVLSQKTLDAVEENQTTDDQKYNMDLNANDVKSDSEMHSSRTDEKHTYESVDRDWDASPNISHIETYATLPKKQTKKKTPPPTAAKPIRFDSRPQRPHSMYVTSTSSCANEDNTVAQDELSTAAKAGLRRHTPRDDRGGISIRFNADGTTTPVVREKRAQSGEKQAPAYRQTISQWEKSFGGRKPSPLPSMIFAKDHHPANTQATEVISSSPPPPLPPMHTHPDVRLALDTKPKVQKPASSSRFGPKLDPREELMLAIRNAGGKKNLKKTDE